MSKLTISVNADVGGFPATQFSEFDFAGLTSFNGQLVMCNDEGIFEYSGDVDEVGGEGIAISAWFEIVTTDFGVLNQKRIRAVLGSGLFAGDMLLMVSMDDGSFTSYAISEDQTMEQSAFKRFVNRAQKGSHITIRFENVLGADFSVDALEAIVMLLHNKPSGLM
jgi:hypothetical protein